MSDSGWAHAEAAAQNIVGVVMAQFVLWCFSIPLASAIGLNIVMFILSYARTYVLRRVFHHVRNAKSECGGCQKETRRSDVVQCDAIDR